MRAMIRAAVAACLCLVSVTACQPVLAADTGGPIATFLDDVQAPAVKHQRSAAYFMILGGLDTANLQAGSGPEAFKFSDQAWLGAIAGGFNIRVPNSPLVFGVELDYALTNVKGTVSPEIVALQASTKYLASLRARVGVAAGPALFYVTGGPAITESKITAESITTKETLYGWSAGVGSEVEFGKVLTLRLEYLRYGFPDMNAGCGVDCLFEAKNKTDVVRAGIGFKLN
jgi:outer membrane immunogenic protein